MVMMGQGLKKTAVTAVARINKKKRVLIANPETAQNIGLSCA